MPETGFQSVEEEPGLLHPHLLLLAPVIKKQVVHVEPPGDWYVMVPHFLHVFRIHVDASL
jgi:hypothetical protein